MKHRLKALTLTAMMIAGALPSSAAPAPVIASDNVEVLASLPDVGAISTAFDPTREVMYVNTLNGISVYDISDPALPIPTGLVPLPHFENEGMSVGQRADGTTFVLVGIDIYAANAGGGGGTTSTSDSIYIVDVTDITAPAVRSYLTVSSSTHTVQCMSVSCEVAWTSGVYDGGTMHAVDLTDLDNPVEVAELSNINGAGGFGVHQWTEVGEDMVIGTGGGGTAIYDISDPLNPIPLNTTDQNGTLAPYNDFIQHNGDTLGDTTAFASLDVDEQLALAPSVDNGNVMVVTEEDYDSPDCQGTVGFDAPEGGVSTWHIPSLDATQHLADNPSQAGNAGTIVPLDTWNSEIYDVGVPTPAGALCSAHYFSTHQDGFIAQGWYQQGTRILDMRDPSDIKQVGYLITTASETWDAEFVPAYDEDGQTGEMTDIIYTNDVARGIDVIQIDLPDTAPAETEDLIAPVLPEWLDLSTRGAAISANNSALLGMCRLTGTASALPSVGSTLGL